MEKKRADWTKDKEFQQTCDVKILNGSSAPRRCTSSTASPPTTTASRPLGARPPGFSTHAGEDFAILGAAEKDSGHEVRRFGEEMLFMALRDHNTDAIKASGVQRIVTADPHAFNALKHDYKDMPPVEHISQVMARAGARRASCGSIPSKTAARLRLSRSLLPGAAQPGLRRAARGAGRYSGLEARGDEPLSRPLVLLRRRRADVVLRAARKSSAWA